MRHRARQEVDRYASVPSFTEDMPIEEEPGFDDRPARAAVVDEDGREREESGVAAAPKRTPRSTAGERPASRSVSQSAAAKRAQPQRKPRSQRGKR
jgi:preprotein translocase subunit SecF